MNLKPFFFAVYLLPAFVLSSQPTDSLRSLLFNSQEESNSLSSAKVMNELGNAFRKKNSDSSIYWLNQSLTVAIEIKNHPLIAKNFFELGEVNYDQKGDLDASLSYFNQSIPIYKKLLNLEQITLNNYKIGRVSLDQGNFLMATEFLLKSLGQFEELKDSTGVSMANNSMGILYAKQQNFHQALIYHRKALAYERHTGLDRKAVNNYRQIGQIYKQMSAYDSALISYKKGLEIGQKIDAPVLMSKLYDNIGNVLELVNMYDSAIFYHEKALKIAQDIQDETMTGWATKGLSSAYFRLGRYKKAMPFAKTAIDIGKRTGEKNLLMQSAEILHQIYSELKDFKSAYAYLLVHHTTGDSLLNTDYIRKRAVLEQEYRYKKNNEIQALELQAQEAYFVRQIDRKETVVYILVTCGSVVLLFLVIIYRNYRIKKRVSLMLQEKNEIIGSQAERLQKLNETKDKFYAILSHDLRGPMSVFQGVPIIVDSFLEKKRYEDLKSFAEKVGNTSVKVTSLLDDLMTWAISQTKDQFPIRKEKINLKHSISEIYGVFDSIAETKSIRLQSEVPDDVFICADLQSIMTVFRNLVNNAIKFTQKNGEVKIAHSTTDGWHHIMVSDNGMGISKEKMDILFTLDRKKLESGTAGEKGVGLGLQLVYDFVKMNDGRVSVESQEGQGTTFTISLPSGA